MPKLIIIGGFGFNQELLLPLLPKHIPYKFWDINSFRPPFTLDEIAMHIADSLLENITYTLLAYSSGGLVALKLAMHYPQKIKFIIGLNATPCLMEKPDWFGISARNLAKLTNKLASLTLTDFQNHFAKIAGQPRKQSARLNPQYFATTNRATLANWLSIIAQTDLRPALNTLPQRIIWLTAADDRLISGLNHLPNQQIIANSTHIHLNYAFLSPLLAGLLVD